ncbi:MAG: hypothetical protein HYX88_00530 [Chloroflexi bacterium]|nr:hypothetical protein [Chloroflexota bacterium]
MAGKATLGDSEHYPSNTAASGRKKEGTSFAILLWQEARDMPGEPVWRWRVTRVQTGETAYFQRLADVLDYVSLAAGTLPPR